MQVPPSRRRVLTEADPSDLNHHNQYVVGLALCTLGNIASIEMSRDLFLEVESLLSTANPYIRRKAALCAMRIVRKVPDLQEHFINKAKALLSDRNHGVLLCGLTLVTTLCEADEGEMDEDEDEQPSRGTVEMVRPLVPQLVRTLKSLTSSGYAPEHDVSGITDPFLQVKILRLFRVLGRGDAATSEQINDILAQVATNTDSSKNVGNSILYEAVLTILEIEADSGLRVLGINILGKFLTNKDNNIRYVALNTLVKVVTVEPNAVQRHRNTILECLRDPDISIRRRALDLSFTLIRGDNVRVLIRELLAFLEVADHEFKPVMTTQIGIAADRYAPNKQWHIDTMLRVIKLAGNHVKEQILSSFVRLIATTPDLQLYSVQKLYSALKADITQEALTLAGTWVIGEYGQFLLQNGSQGEDGAVNPVTETDMVDLLLNILNSTYANQVVTEYIITSAMKLTTRLSDPTQIERIRRLMSQRTTDLNVEIQQRAVEYKNLFGYNDIRLGVLERMPPPEISEEQRVLGPAPTSAKEKKSGRALRDKSGKKSAKQSDQDMLLDLMGGGGSGGDDGTSPGFKSPASGGGQNTADLLADILGGADSAKDSPATTGPSNNKDSIMDLLGGGGTGPGVGAATAAVNGTAGTTTTQPKTSTEPSSSSSKTLASSSDLLSSLSSSTQASTAIQTSHSFAATSPHHPVYEKNNLVVTMTVNSTPSAAQLQAHFRNSSSSAGRLSGVGLQAAVPKSQKLVLQAINKAVLEPGQEATQAMRIMPASGVRVFFFFVFCFFFSSLWL